MKLDSSLKAAAVLVVPFLAVLFGTVPTAAQESAEVRSRFGRDFILKVLPRSENESFRDALIGKFLGNRCSEILARSTVTEKMFLLQTDSSPREVTGLSASFPLVDAAPLDVNGDGRSDLIAYDKEDRKWKVALSELEYGFQVKEYDLPGVVPAPRKIMLSGGGESFRALVNSPKKIHELAFRDDSGLFEFSVERNESNQPVLGVLTGRIEQEQGIGFFSRIYRFPWKPRSLMRLTPPIFVVWAEFPENVSSLGALFGDFDGNGYTDALVSGWNFGRWWIAEGGPGVSAMEFPVDGLEEVTVEPEEISVGDYDCDGRDDLLLKKTTRGNLSLALSRVLKEEERTDSSRLRGRALSSQLGPFVCVGYLPWSEYQKWGDARFCPAGYAVFSSRRGSHGLIDACCKLPQPDMLSEQNTYHDEYCPEGSVVTGFSMQKKLRCTAVNQTRYTLLPPDQGIHWGFGRDRQREERSVQKVDVPQGLRAALGRRSFQHWDQEGCLGYPWGGVLVSRPKKGCREEKYRRFAFNGLGRDPKFGTPVDIFPDCISGINPFDPNAGCAVRQKSVGNDFINGDSNH